MQMSMENLKNTDASIKNLETHIWQIVKQLPSKQGGTFTANTHTNPKEHYKLITARSDRVIESGIDENMEKESIIVEIREE